MGQVREDSTCWDNERPSLHSLSFTTPSPMLPTHLHLLCNLSNLHSLLPKFIYKVVFVKDLASMACS